VPNLVIFGHYGVQRWDAASGELSSPEPPAALAAVRRELPDLMARVGVDDVWIEDKTIAVAVHTRRSADPAVALATVTPVVIECARRHGLAVEPGRPVLEIRSPGTDKGATLRSHARDRAARSVCYIGDDLGDLPAFEAVQALRDNGIPGLTVASGSTEVAALADRADLVVDGPPGVVALLTSLAELLVRATHDGG
jgi:trehalose 6-phosphate phosphatase